MKSSRGSFAIPTVGCRTGKAFLLDALAGSFIKCVDESDVPRDLKIGHAAFTPSNQIDGSRLWASGPDFYKDLSGPLPQRRS